MGTERMEIDAGTASSIVKKYIDETYGNLGSYTFRIHSIEKNSKEDIWIVKCEAYTTAKDTKPTQYTLKVNIKTGQIVNIVTG